MDKKYIIPVFVALLNIGLFGAMFLAMNYFEFIGADNHFFDDGSLNNIKILQSFLGSTGLDLDPTKPHRITTLMWALCLGISFIASFFAIVVANRKSLEECEVTDPVA